MKIIPFQCILSDINDSKLAFEVYDKDMIGVDDTIGCAFVNLSKKPSIVVGHYGKFKSSVLYLLPLEIIELPSTSSLVQSFKFNFKPSTSRLVLSTTIMKSRQDQSNSIFVNVDVITCWREFPLNSDKPSLKLITMKLDLNENHKFKFHDLLMPKTS